VASEQYAFAGIESAKNGWYRIGHHFFQGAAPEDHISSS
jgi:hypothetical protein